MIVKLAHFYRLTTAQVRACSLADVDEMLAYMHEYEEAVKKANDVH